MTKKASGPDTIYQLRLQLQDIEPPIWRQVRVRGSLGLDGLHAVIQKVMGWKDYHLHEFTVRGERYASPIPRSPTTRSGRTTRSPCARPRRWRG
jgi:hypothetical protein